MSERDSGVPEGRCGFELRPEDVGVDWDLTEFRDWTEAVSCWRETWRNGRCLWHADTDEKPVDKLVAEAQNEPDKRLDGAIFRDVELNQRISFADFTLTGARFENVDLQGAIFSDADLRGAEFPQADLPWAEFHDAYLQEAEFPHAKLFSAEFRHANLRKTKFPDATLREAEFPDADLRKAEFPDADLRKAEFPDATLRKAEFPDVTLRGAEFLDATLREVEFPHANLREAEFPDANLREAKFPDTNLRYADFSDAHLHRAVFTDADLRFAKLPDIEAPGVDFTHTNLQEAILTRADCRGATFTSALMYETVLADMRINSYTTFSDPASTFYDSITSRPACVYEEIELIADGNDESEITTGELPSGTHRLQAASWVYRRLESLHEENALSDQAAEFHVSKEEAERKRLREQPREGSWREWETWKKRGRASVKYGMYKTSRHGESVGRVLLSWVAVIGLFALLFPLVGGIREDDGTVHAIKSLAELTTVAGWSDILLNAYFSVITFSTIGYGDLSPHGPLSRVLVAFESLAGAVLVALLIFVLGRRVAR